jgi:hypothetical protein
MPAGGIMSEAPEYFETEIMTSLSSLKDLLVSEYEETKTHPAFFYGIVVFEDGSFTNTEFDFPLGDDVKLPTKLHMVGILEKLKLEIMDSIKSVE